MEADNKSGNLFETLIQHIHDPFLVLDVEGKILSFNTEASELLNLDKDNDDLFSYLDESSIEELKLTFSKKLPLKTSFTLKARFVLKTEEILDAKVVLNSYKEKDNKYIFCRILNDRNKIVINGNTKIVVKTNDYKEIIHNVEILDIIEEVKSLYPFTFIGKEKIQYAINKLELPFWIQNIDGNYQILNDKVSGSLGISITQIEGKPVNSFLPAHLIDFHNSIVSYIQKSLNCIVLEGIPIKNYGNGLNYQTIEIPLSDVDNNVMAIIGINQPVSRTENGISVQDIINSPNDLLKYFPKAIMLVNRDGIIQQATEEFRKLFENEFDDLRKLNYKSILPEDIVGIIDQFILSSSDKKISELYNLSKFKKKYSGEIVLQLNKIYDEKLDFEGVSILIENIEERFDIDKIFVRKGKMYELLIENNPEPIFIYDTENLRFLNANSSALELYGYRKDEFLQMDLTDLYTTEDIQTLLDTSKNELDGKKFSGPYKHKKKDGSSVFVEISKSSFKFEDKEAHFNVVRDVTEKLELEKRNKSFDAVFNNNNNLIFVTDTSGFVLFVNDTACSVLGRKKEDFPDSSFASYLVDEDRGAINTSVFKQRVDQPTTLNLCFKIHQGDSFDAEVTAIPVLSYKNEIESYTIIVKKKEESIVVTKDVNVEKPVEENTSAAITEKIEPSFLSNVFHEILTPINVILGFTQELTESLSNLTPAQKESKDIINQNRERLLNTMNSVMEYSKIGKNKIDYDISNVAITEIIEHLDLNINEITGSKNVEFAYGKISSSLKFKSDKEKIQHFINLLVKFAASVTKENKIYFSAYPEKDNTFIISVKDGYDKPSGRLLEFFKKLFFNENFEFKEYGISRLNADLAKSLLKSLDGNAVISKKNKTEDVVIVLPMVIKEKLSSEAENEDESRANKIESAIEELTDESVYEAPEQKNKYRTIEDELDEMEKAQNSGQKDVLHSEVEPQVDELADSKNEAEYEMEKNFNELDFENVNKSASENTLNKIDLSKLRCLYIEDQVDSQILFKVQMKELKEIKFAVSFEEAIPILDSDSFNFIVMDINLQGEYNGLDALKLIQKMIGYENTPIIAVTAYVLPGDKEKFITAGFNEFIAKPIFKEKMIEALERIYSL